MDGSCHTQTQTLTDLRNAIARVLQETLEKIKVAATSNDYDVRHRDADRYLCNALLEISVLIDKESLGDKVCDAYEDIEKFYI